MRSRALWRILPYARPYVRRMLLAGVTSLAGLAAAASIPMVTKAVIDGPLTEGTTQGLWGLAGLAAALGLLETVSAFLRRSLATGVGLSVEADLRNDLYAHLQRLPVAFHDGWRSGQLIARAVYDINAIRRFLGFGIVFFVLNAVTFLVVCVMLFRLYPPLALVTGAGLLPVIVLVRRFERRYRRVARRIQDEQGDVATTIEESAVGIRIIKAFGRGPERAARFRAEATQLRGSTMEAVGIRATFWPTLSLVPNLVQAGILLGGGLAVIGGSLTVGGLVAFITYLLMLDWPVRALGWILAMGEESATAAERLFEVFDEEPAIADRPGARPLETCLGHIRFEGVAFSFPGGGGEVLRDVWLDVPPGETLAVVGATGSGKTGLVSLVPRLYDVTGGRVTVDGHDVRDLTLSSLRRHIGVAFEDPILFSVSVRENLLLGRPGATDEEIRRALAVARADFVDELPWGLDTRIGEQGYSLSGGQRQRLALARAIIGRPPILVLDDPLSSVDVHTEAEVEAALADILANATALLVVHRPSTLALADRVALLDGGTLVATGTHEELMATQPVYRAILSQEAEEVPA